MSTTLEQLAQLVGGQLHGDPTTTISGAAPLGEAKPGEITLIDHRTKLARLDESPAVAAITPSDAVPTDRAAIAVDDVHQAFSAIVCHFRPPRTRPRIGRSPLAVIAESATIAADVDIHPGVVIGEDVQIGPGSTLHAGVQVMAGCRLGAGVTLMPGAVLYEDTVLGERVLVHANAVIGSYGFGYQTVEGRHQLGPQFGHVQIDHDVEIGAGTTIDRGAYGVTLIGAGTKIDNLVQIGHNCRIGQHNMICAQVGIAGSTSTGDYVVMAGQVGIRDHVHIGAGAVLGALAGVANNVEEGAVMIGIPATPEREQKLKQAALAKLPEMRREFKTVKRTLQRLVEQLDDDTPAAA